MSRACRPWEASSELISLAFGTGRLRICSSHPPAHCASSLIGRTVASQFIARAFVFR